MKKILLLTAAFTLLSLSAFSQIIPKGELFTKIYTIDKKVVFIKEIPSKEGQSILANYEMLKSWGKELFGKDPFNSSIYNDEKNQAIYGKSRVELILPENSDGVREKMLMRYKISGYVFEKRCVLEISDISYLYQEKTGDVYLRRAHKAEEFITDAAVATKDPYQEVRANTLKGTLYFLNQLSANFESVFQ